MEKYQDRSMGAGRVGCKICERSATQELTQDITLPDYQPEVKRLLSVDARVLSTDKFIGAGAAQLSGNIEYRILYMAPDGGIYSAKDVGEYQVSVPVEIPSEIDMGDGLVSLCDILPESTVGRVAAPRKLSLKCRLSAGMRLFGTRVLEERINGGGAGKLERLYKTVPALRLFTGKGDALELGDEILCETEESGLRVVMADATPCVNEAVAGSGCVNLRGEVLLKLICCRESENAVPYVQNRRIPFQCNVPVDGAEVNCMAYGKAVCTALAVTVEDGRLLCEVTVIPEAYAMRNEDISYTADLYATGAMTEGTYETMTLPHVLGVREGNFSLNSMLTLDEAGIRAGQTVVDLTMTPFSLELEDERGKYTVSGKCRCRALILGDGEGGMQEFEIPFRYVSDGEREPMSGYSVEVAPISVKWRMDGERLGIDAEMAVTLATHANARVAVFSGADITPAAEREAAYMVCYPSREDTLWSVAKRYSRSIDDIAAMNPLQELPAADAPESLAGVAYLLV